MSALRHKQSFAFDVQNGYDLGRSAIFLVGPAHDDPERIVRQSLWPHPTVRASTSPLFVGGQDHRHGLVDSAIAANASTHQGPKGATWR
jgi:hypothetical protein